MSLTDTEVKNTKPKDNDYKIRDRDNMYLVVTKKGKKYWRMDYRHDGKRKTITFGTYPSLKLKEARSKCTDARDKLENGLDPKYETVSTEKTFEEAGLEWFKEKMLSKSESHKSRSLRNLEKELFPHIRGRQVTDITPPELLKLLRDIEDRGIVDTAHRVKQTAGQVFDYCIACGYCTLNPARQLVAALKPSETKHYPSITDPIGVGRLMVAIDEYSGTAVIQTALKLSALFFLRPGEMRHLEWSDIDLNEKQIIIPAQRMKMSMDHIIPISIQAKRLLMQLQKLTGHGKYIFPSTRGGSRPISENGVRTALRTMGYSNEMFVPHGFRAMARTLLDEHLEFNIVWIEQQLAHVVKDANGRAYNRTKHLKQRHKMMQRWADYLDKLRGLVNGQNVLPIIR